MGHEAIATFRGLGQIEHRPALGVQARDHFLGQDNAKGIADLPA